MASSSDRKGKRPADDNYSEDRLIEEYYKKIKKPRPDLIPDTHSFLSHRYNGEPRYRFLYLAGDTEYFWDTKTGKKIMAKATKKSIKKNMALYLRNKRIAKQIANMNRPKRRKLSRRKRRYKKKKLIKRIRIIGKDKNNKTYIIHKKKLKQVRQIRKLFKSGTTVKRENIKNEGQNIVENVGFNKYRYFSFLQMTVSDVYEYFKQYAQYSNTATTGTSTQLTAKAYIFDQAGTSETVGLYSQTINEGKGLYIGKAIYHYEITNPTNYTMYVDMYDIIAKKDYVNTSPKPFYDYNQAFLSNQSSPPSTGTNPATPAQGFPQSNIIEYPDLPYPEACMYYDSIPFTTSRNRYLYPNQSQNTDITYSDPQNGTLGTITAASSSTQPLVSGNLMDQPATWSGNQNVTTNGWVEDDAAVIVPNVPFCGSL